MISKENEFSYSNTIGVVYTKDGSGRLKLSTVHKNGKDVERISVYQRSTNIYDETEYEIVSEIIFTPENAALIKDLFTSDNAELIKGLINVFLDNSLSFDIFSDITDES